MGADTAISRLAFSVPTGYSKGYCSTIWAATWTPHVLAWPALSRLVGLDVAELVANKSSSAYLDLALAAP